MLLPMVSSLSLSRYRTLPTEQPLPNAHALDQLPVEEVLRLMNQEDLRAVRAVGRQVPQIARAVRLATKALRNRGRLFFVGAGTSGRLGVIEAAECPPTFQTRPGAVQAIIAGGRRAVFRSQEGDEDHRAAAWSAVRKRRIRTGDVVVGITASGLTPFVDEALRTAARLGAECVLVTCHPLARIPARVRIVLSVGPEVLAGSTRLKAGTATKLVLNMLTLAAMVQLGKTHGNLMVDVRPASRKLRARALGIVQSLADLPERDAAALLRTTRGRAKAAVLMARGHLSYAAAQRALRRAGGSLRRALAQPPTREAERAP